MGSRGPGKAWWLLWSVVVACGSPRGGRGQAGPLSTSMSVGTQGVTDGDGDGAGEGSATTGSSGPTGDDEDTGSAIVFDMGAIPDAGASPTQAIPTTCDEAQDSATTVGCTFAAVDLDSHDDVETEQFAVVVSNPQEAATATVTVEVGSVAGWVAVAGPVMVGPSQLHSFELPDRHQDDSGVYADGSYRITSDVPIVAYQFNPVDGATSFLSDASMLYPQESWDHSYTAVTWRATDDDEPQGAYLSIVAAVDGTAVTVTPPVATMAGSGVPAGSPGVPFQVNLDEGDVAEVMTKAFGVALTGTRIVSDEDHPIAVFTGHECAWIPINTEACDHLEEQLSSSRLWGSHYIASRFPVRGTPAEPTVWHIIAAQDGTIVDIDADAGVTGLPPNGSLTLNAGQVAELTVSGTAADPGHFELQADGPIGVFAYMVGANLVAGAAIGDPAVVQLSAVEQHLDHYGVLVPGTWEQDFAIITRPLGSTTNIDGVAVDDALFLPVAGSGFSVGFVPVDDGTHLVDGSAPFSIVITGFDQFDSYAYLGGTGAAVLHPEG